MKVVILAGGKGTRISEEQRPKPMVEIGGKPMIWHIMSIYAANGYKEFLVACGFKGEVIKEYFHNFFIHSNDYVIDLKDGSLKVLTTSGTDWKIGVIDTGLDTQTGGRIKRLRSWIGDDTFMVTYGDGVGAIDIRKLVAFHRNHGKLASVTAVRPPARFGGLSLHGNSVKEFSEKPQTGEGWINGGFFVFEPGVFDYLEGDETILERDPLERLAADGQLMAFKHTGFWQPMDTLREKHLLDQLWANGEAPWKIWERDSGDGDASSSRARVAS
jgi:glucose-1-phosphate cytidylyltransferase